MAEVVRRQRRGVARHDPPGDRQDALPAHRQRLGLAVPVVRVQRHLAGQTPRRVIYVAGKLLNIVV